MPTLSGKLALITGAGVGIGQGCARAFAREGAAVVLHYASSGAGADEVVDEITRAGGRARALSADLTRIDECFRLVDEAVAFLGGLDVLVNNAGVTRTVPFFETTPETYDEVLNLNLRGYFFCAQRAGAIMAAGGGGVVINMSSIHGSAGLSGYAAYAASKGGVNAFTRELAIELAPQRIRVNCIAPGVIEVPRYHTPGYDRAKLGSRVPWGRVGWPDDVAAMAVFLASDAAEFTTGQVIHVDGGTHARIAIFMDS